jgi:hypothetical protein
MLEVVDEEVGRADKRQQNVTGNEKSRMTAFSAFLQQSKMSLG